MVKQLLFLFLILTKPYNTVMERIVLFTQSPGKIAAQSSLVVAGALSLSSTTAMVVVCSPNPFYRCSETRKYSSLLHTAHVTVPKSILLKWIRTKIFFFKFQVSF